MRWQCISAKALRMHWQCISRHSSALVSACPKQCRSYALWMFYQAPSVASCRSHHGTDLSENGRKTPMCLEMDRKRIGMPGNAKWEKEHPQDASKWTANALECLQMPIEGEEERKEKGSAATHRNDHWMRFCRGVQYWKKWPQNAFPDWHIFQSWKRWQWISKKALTMR